MMNDDLLKEELESMRFAYDELKQNTEKKLKLFRTSRNALRIFNNEIRAILIQAPKDMWKDRILDVLSNVEKFEEKLWEQQN